MNPLIIGVYGKSNSGKTTLIVRIIKYFSKEGFKICCVKKSDKTIYIDTKGKDTWKFSDSGAKLVVLSSNNNTDYLLNQSLDINDIISQINNFEDFDIIIVEGANDDFIKKIRVGNIELRKNTLLTFKSDFEEIIKILKNEILFRKNMSKMSIKVNGKNIIITEFPEDFIKNTICGMLKSLKGVKEIKNVEIKF